MCPVLLKDILRSKLMAEWLTCQTDTSRAWIQIQTGTSHCFFEQETLCKLLSNDWFQECI